MIAIAIMTLLVSSCMVGHTLIQAWRHAKNPPNIEWWADYV